MNRRQPWRLSDCLKYLFLERFPIKFSVLEYFPPNEKDSQGILTCISWPFLATAELPGFVLSRYLNGVMKNAAAPVLLELANEVIIFTFFSLIFQCKT